MLFYIKYTLGNGVESWDYVMSIEAECKDSLAIRLHELAVKEHNRFKSQFSAKEWRERNSYMMESKTFTIYENTETDGSSCSWNDTKVLPIHEFLDLNYCLGFIYTAEEYLKTIEHVVINQK